jgi:hypothetical protein
VIALSRRVIVSLVLFSAVALCGGCLFLAGAAVGAGAATGATLYAEGSLTVMMDKNPPQIAQATQLAFKDLGIAQTSASIGDASSIVEGVYGDDHVKVTIEKQGDNVSKMWIRIGTFGDERKSINIYDKIKTHL